MVKIVAVLVSLLIGATSSYLMYSLGGYNILTVSLLSPVFAIGAFLVIVILFFAFLFFTGFFEGMKKTREYQSSYFRFMLRTLEKFLFSLFGMKNHCTGKDLISSNETYLFIGNHRSNLDSMILDVYLKDIPLVFIAKKSLFKIPFVRHFIHGCAYVKLDRNDPKKDYEAISLAEEMLTRENKPLSVGVFPEGTRNHSDDPANVQEFKPGTFRIIKKTMRPIVLFAVRGTKETNKNLLFKRHHCYVDILEVIDYETYKDMDVNEIASYSENKIREFLKANTKEI